MKCKGIEATFRIPILEYDVDDVPYNKSTYISVAKEMIGVPVTNANGSKCYGIVNDVTTDYNDGYLIVEALLFSGRTEDQTIMMDGVAETKRIVSLALGEEWSKVQADD